MKNDPFHSHQGMPLCPTAPYIEIRQKQSRREPAVPSDLSWKSQTGMGPASHAATTAGAGAEAAQYVAVRDVRTSLLVRDRLHATILEMDELTHSIAKSGLINPIVVQTTPAGPELVQGERRLSAYRRLLEETNDPIWQFIPAIVLPQDTKIADLYSRMVNENLLHKRLSYAEMAVVSMSYAADPDTPDWTVDAAIDNLFEPLSSEKRDTIRDFAKVMSVIGDDLRHPTFMSRNLGQTIAREIATEPALVRTLRTALHRHNNRTAAEEAELLWRCLS